MMIIHFVQFLSQDSLTYQEHSQTWPSQGPFRDTDKQKWLYWLHGVQFKQHNARDGLPERKGPTIRLMLFHQNMHQNKMK